MPGPWMVSSMLYLIEILHQTTTLSTITVFMLGCILLKFYIKPQLRRQSTPLLSVVSYWNSTSNHNNLRCSRSALWVVSYWNSTSNHNFSYAWPGSSSLYLIEILHQTTTLAILLSLPLRCILLKFYIKPQLQGKKASHYRVVSYWNSTSNHNIAFNDRLGRRVVSYWNSTSNHNWFLVESAKTVLYLIEILHQTTTWTLAANGVTRLYLIEILHQTTTSPVLSDSSLGCILLKFYIKPQLRRWRKCHYVVVSYWNSTSNHNLGIFWKVFAKLYLIEILHQTTTFRHFLLMPLGCILLKFYIKPQQIAP